MHSKPTIQSQPRIDKEMSRDMRFSTIWYVRSAKAQTGLRICADWSEPLLVAYSLTVKLLTERHLEFLSLE